MTNPLPQPEPIDEAQQLRALDALAQEARIVEKARMLPASGELSKEQIQLARDTLRSYLDEKKIPISVAAKQIARSASTLSDWLRGNYSGDSVKLARMAMVFVEQHARGQKPGMPVGMITTDVVKRGLAIMRDVQRTRSLGLIVGCAGISKSMLCQACEASLIVGSVHMECVEGHRSPTQFAQAWADRLGLRSGGALGAVERRIIEALRGSGRLQMIDEAHYLGKPSLNVVRDVHKQAGVGVMLLGTIDVDRAVDDATAFYGQFTRLITWRYDILEEQMSGGTPIFSVKDIVKLAETMQLSLEGDAAEFLTELACVPGWGGLGAAAALLHRARVLSQGKPIALKDLHDSLRSSAGVTRFRRMMDRRDELVRRIKIA